MRVPVLVLVLVLGLVGCGGDAVEPPPPIQPGSLATAQVLEPSSPFDMPYGVDTDREGVVYVLDAGNNRVVVFDPDGTQIGQWDGSGSDEGPIETLGFGGLAVAPDGAIWVVDNGNHLVRAFDGDGVQQIAFGSEGTGEGEMTRAIGIAVTAEEVFVTDDAVPEVTVFDHEGRFLRRIGGPAEDQGGLSHPTGITVTQDGTVYVADYEAERIVRFDADGTMTGVWLNPGPAGSYTIPEGLDATGDGTVLATTYREGQLVVLPADPGEADWPTATSPDVPAGARLLAPVDVAVAADGSVYVTDQRAGTVVRYASAPPVQEG